MRSVGLTIIFPAWTSICWSLILFTLNDFDLPIQAPIFGLEKKDNQFKWQLQTETSLKENSTSHSKERLTQHNTDTLWTFLTCAKLPKLHHNRLCRICLLNTSWRHVQAASCSTNPHIPCWRSLLKLRYAAILLYINHYKAWVCNWYLNFTWTENSKKNDKNRNKNEGNIVTYVPLPMRSEDSSRRHVFNLYSYS